MSLQEGLKPNKHLTQVPATSQWPTPAIFLGLKQRCPAWPVGCIWPAEVSHLTYEASSGPHRALPEGSSARAPVTAALIPWVLEPCRNTSSGIHNHYCHCCCSQAVQSLGSNELDAPGLKRCLLWRNIEHENRY